MLIKLFTFEYALNHDAIWQIPEWQRIVLIFFVGSEIMTECVTLLNFFEIHAIRSLSLVLAVVFGYLEK